MTKIAESRINMNRLRKKDKEKQAKNQKPYFCGIKLVLDQRTVYLMF